MLERLINTTQNYLEKELTPHHFEKMKISAIDQMRKILSDSIQTQSTFLFDLIIDKNKDFNFLD